MKGGAGGVEVFIRGRSYLLRAEDDPEYVVELARLLDERMTAVETSTKTVDTLRLAVLAALNLTDEYCKLEKEHRSLIRDREQEQARLLAMIEETLKEE